MYGINPYQGAAALPSATNTPLRNPGQQFPVRSFQPGQYGAYGNDALAANYMVQPQLQYPGLMQQPTPLQNVPSAQPGQPLLQQPIAQAQLGANAFNLQQSQNPTAQIQDLQSAPIIAAQTFPSSNPAPAPVAAPAVASAPAVNNNQPLSLKTWNTSFNNTPVEKGPPVNVVITSSDPLPAHNTVPVVSQATFSVTIPPQHIKNKTTAAPPSKANPTITAALQETQTPPTAQTVTSNTNATPVPSLAQQRSIFGNVANKPLSSTPLSSPATNAVAAKDTNTKPNPFAGFSFGSPSTNNVSATTTPVAEAKTDKPNLGSIFSGIGKQSTTPTTVASQSIQKVESAANTSVASHKEDEDDYVPTAHFEPVIELPDLIDVKTGEENETILFEHRAKLLRFVKESKEWKERGLGNMKILVNKNDPNKVRLLMRREQVLKLCCNQLLTKDTNFKKLPNSEVAMSWYGQDYSENELQVELLAIRFKTADVCKQFYDAILKAQASMTANGGAIAPPATAATGSKTSSEKPQGFGDKFKAKPGAWTCQGCYLTNKADDIRCPACNAPKDKDAVETKEKSSTPAPLTSKFTFGCQPATTNTATKNLFGTPTQSTFRFGASPTTTASPTVAAAPATTAVPAALPASGFGDQFKPKAGSWSCKACYTSNTGTDLYCLACEGPKDDTVPKKEPKSLLANTSKSLR